MFHIYHARATLHSFLPGRPHSPLKVHLHQGGGVCTPTPGRIHHGQEGGFELGGGGSRNAKKTWRPNACPTSKAWTVLTKDLLDLIAAIIRDVPISAMQGVLK
jgi:hypothetical protein